MKEEKWEEKKEDLTFNNSGGMNVKATQAAISRPQTTALMAIRCQMEGREEEGEDLAILMERFFQ